MYRCCEVTPLSALSECHKLRREVELVVCLDDDKIGWLQDTKNVHGCKLFHKKRSKIEVEGFLVCLLSFQKL